MKHLRADLLIWVGAAAALTATYYLPLPYTHLPILSEFDCEDSILTVRCARGAIVGGFGLVVLFALLSVAARPLLNRVQPRAPRLAFIFCIKLALLFLIGRTNYVSLASYRELVAGHFHLGTSRFFHLSQLLCDLLQALILTIAIEFGTPRPH